MASNYRKLGDVIKLVDERNTDGNAEELLGVAIEKRFMPSVANVIGTDLSKYKLVSKDRFACNPMHVGRDEKLPIARYDADIPAIVSPAYFTFDVASDKVLPRYLELWFNRSEFDRRCWFATDASVRGGLSWDAICDIPIDLPTVEEQGAVINRFDAIEARISQLRRLNDKLAACARRILEEGMMHAASLSTVKLRDVVTMQYGYTQSASEQAVGPKFLRITDITSEYLDWNTVPHCSISQADQTKYELNVGDIVVARTGVTSGKARYFASKPKNAVFASFLVRLIANDSAARTFLGLTVCSNAFFRFIQANAGAGSQQLQANPPLLGQYEFEYPDADALGWIDRNASPFLQAVEANEAEMSLLGASERELLSMLY